MYKQEVQDQYNTHRMNEHNEGNVQLFFTLPPLITQRICPGVIGFSENVEAILSEDLPAQLVHEE